MATANQIRGLVAVQGWVGPKHLWRLRAALPDWLEDAENGLSERFRRLLAELDRRVEERDKEIEAIAKNDPIAQRLQQLRGVGPLIATALVAALGSGEQFAKRRDLAASPGLTPKQHSTGGKERLLGTSFRRFQIQLTV
jgi:transposase